MYEGLAKHIIWQAITIIIMCGALFEVYPDLVLEEMIKQLLSLSCFLRVLSTNTDLLYLDMTRRIESKDYHFPKILCSWMIYYFTKYIAYFH